MILNYIISAAIVLVVAFLLWAATGMGYSFKFSAVLFSFAVFAGIGLWWNHSYTHSNTVLLGILIAGIFISHAILDNSVRTTPSIVGNTPENAPKSF